MKRPSQDVVGRPVVAAPRRDVASTIQPSGSYTQTQSQTKTLSHTGLDVASFRHALNDPMATAAEDAALAEDFSDFLHGDGSGHGFGESLPDPQFQERLRRRLWRTYALTHLRDRGETH